LAGDGELVVVREGGGEAVAWLGLGEEKGVGTWLDVGT